ncbi:MAG: TonB-dependent receptor plug domain-containing protein, partial [Gemmatimonadota bacterium]
MRLRISRLAPVPVVVVLLVMFGAPVAAQRTTGTIQGTVVDSVSGAPVVGALVQLGEGGRTEFSHGDGSFHFVSLTPGRYEISVDRLGFASTTRDVTVVAGETVRVRIGLGVTVFDLGGLVVTGTIGARAGRDMLSPTTVVSGAELDRKLDLTVAATLQSEPGVSVSGMGANTGRPIIRGLGGDRILILEDGARTGDMSSTSADHAVAVEALSAQRFEVVRGPMSLIYGSSALGGVVNVVRDEVPSVLPSDVHGVMSVQGTSVNSGISAGGYATTGFGRLALRGEATYRASGDMATPAGDLENTGVRNVNLSAGAAYIGEDAHGGAAYRFYDNEYGIPGGFVGGHEDGVTVAMRRHNVRAEGELHTEGLVDGVELRTSYTDYHHTEFEEQGSVGTTFTQGLGAAEAITRHGVRGPFTEGALGFRGQYRDIRTGGSLRTPSTYDYTLAGYVVEEIGSGDVRAQVGAR